MRVFALSAIAAVLAASAAPLEAAPKKTKPVAAAPKPALSVDEQAVALRDAALQRDDAYDFVSQLTTRFGARPAGSESERKAAEWSAAEMKKMGFANVRVETFPLYVWERGPASAEITAPFPQKIVATALGGSASSAPEGVEAEAVLFDTYADFTDYTGDLTGKIVVVLQPTVRVQTGGGYGQNSRPLRSQGPLAAKKRGAVGYVMRSLGTEDHRFAHDGATVFQDQEGIPSFAISPPDAMALDRIKVMQKKGEAGPVRLKLFTQNRFVGMGTSQNVIGEIVGSEKPDEVVTIGGHLDSWDHGTGAIDDGAGVAITLAAAKLMIDQGVTPKRTIRVIFYGSEEVSQPGGQGLAGATAYAVGQGDKLSGHIAASESDFGAGLIYSLALPDKTDDAFKARLGKVLYPLGIFVSPQPATSGGPDTSPQQSRGVPVFTLNQDGTDYFDVHHTPDDVLERIDPKKLRQNVAAWAATLWFIANTDVTFIRPAPRQ